MIRLSSGQSWKLWTYWLQQLARKLGLTSKRLNTILEIEAKSYVAWRKRNKRPVTSDMLKYGNTPIFDWFHDKRNKFRDDSAKYLADKYWKEYKFDFDKNR